jgi:tRNA U54 and U55 pseudouridine synthase Pus10
VGKHLSKTKQKNVSAQPTFLPSIVKREVELEALATAVKYLEDFVNDDKPRCYPSMSLSLGLTLAARDLACELGQLSIVT